MEPTGEQFEIAHQAYAATCVEAGGALTALRHRGQPITAEVAAGEPITGGRGQLLMPWPNRLRDGRYRFDGVEQQLAVSEPRTGNASHGLVRWCSWSLLEREAAAVTLGYRLMAQSGYPWTLDLTACYRLADDGLTVTLTATNRSATTAPFAAGAHPYVATGAHLDQTTLTLPARERLLLDDRQLPTGVEPVAGPTDFRAGAPLADVTLDDGFTGLDRGPDGRAVAELAGPRRVRLWVDEAWPWLQVYTADTVSGIERRAVAVEPMTAPPDAFNSGTDLLRLAPGATWSGSYGIEALE